MATLNEAGTELAQFAREVAEDSIAASGDLMDGAFAEALEWDAALAREHPTFDDVLAIAIDLSAGLADLLDEARDQDNPSETVARAMGAVNRLHLLVLDLEDAKPVRRNAEEAMGLFRPWTMRALAEYAGKVCAEWDANEDDREDRINPDEPIVMAVPDPEWDGDPGSYDDDDEGNPYYAYYHVESYGGGSDIDDDGCECGHDGLHLTGMEIDQSVFLFNGRRIGKGA